MPGSHVVHVVDDDLAMREAVDNLLRSCGFNALTYGSAAAYMDADKPDVPACLVLDIELPDINGLDLQRQLAATCHPPIVFITGHGDIPSSVRAMKAGAVDFLAKPFSDESLLAAVRGALAADRKRRRETAALDRLRRCYESLTPREREVLPLIVSGLLNKQAAAELGISVVTLQIHRGHIMRKMAARSLADLVRISGSLDIPLYERRESAPG